MNKPKKSRLKRITPTPGMWTVLSSGIKSKIKVLLNRSHQNKKDGKLIFETIYGIPLIFSCMRSMCIEIENTKVRFKKPQYSSELLDFFKSGDNKNDIKKIAKFYNLGETIKQDLHYAIEIRNEIIHPSPYPEDGHNLPPYLDYFLPKKILWSPPLENFAHDLFWYFQTHELFEWMVQLFIQVSKSVYDTVPDDIGTKTIYEDYFDPEFWFKYD